MPELIAICTYCNKQCEPIILDEGYGFTEAWGITTNHHDYITASICCHEDIIDPFGNLITVQQVQEYINQFKAEQFI